MKICRFALTLLISPLCSIGYCDQPPDLTQQLELFQELKSDLQLPMTELEKSYVNRLSTLLRTAKAKANLEEAVEIEEEITNFRTRGDVIPAEYPDLKNARRIYEENAERIRKESHDKMRKLYLAHMQKLSELRDVATRESRLDDALAIKNAIEALTAEVPSETYQKRESSIVTGLIAHWTFDRDGSDTSGNDRHLKLVGSRIERSGKIGGALETKPGTYAEAPVDAAFDLQHPYSIAFWIMVDEDVLVDEYAPMITKGSNSWRIQMWKEGIVPTHHMSIRGRFLTANSSPGDFRKGNWHHLTAVYDGKVGRIFIDGKEKGHGSLGADQYPDRTPSAVRVGGNVDMARKGLDALFDDVRVYDRALSPNEILELVRLEEG